MQLIGAAGQQSADPMFDASGTITSGGTPQLILAQSVSRAMFIVENLSVGDLWLGIGGATATATLTSGVVTSCAVKNGGFGYTYPPLVAFLGGGYDNNRLYLGLGQPSAPSPSKPASAHAVLTNHVVTSIVVDDPGALYAIAPYVLLQNDPRDPYGCMNPSTVGGGRLWLPPGGGGYYTNETSVTTSALALYGATTGQEFTLKWMI